MRSRKVAGCDWRICRREEGQPQDRADLREAVNAIMTTTYWEIGRRIVEYEQEGKARAEYGEALLERLAGDLTACFGRGFSARNVWQMKAFDLAWPIPQTASAELPADQILQTVSAESSLAQVAARFPLPGPPTSAFSPPRTRTPGSSTRPRPCAPAGRCAS